MAYSFVQYPISSTTTGPFSFTFSYISKFQVEVRKNSVLLTDGVDYTWPTGSTISLVANAVNGDVIEIRRNSLKKLADGTIGRMVDFQNSAKITEAVLDQEGNQEFNLAQEAFDASANGIQLASDGKFDAISKTIKNVATPTQAADAATKNYVDSTVLGGVPSTPLAIGSGGTGGATASAALDNLGFSGYVKSLLASATAAVLRALFTPLTTKGDLWVFGTVDARKAVGATDGYPLQVLSGSADGLAYLPPSTGHSLIGGFLEWTTAGNVLTVAVKTWAGNDPSATEPVYYAVRDVTTSGGSFVFRKLTAALSATLSNGSTAGVPAITTAFRLWAVIFNDAGTDRIGIVNCLKNVSGPPAELSIFPLTGWGIASSTAEGGAGAADSAHTFYTGTAVAAKAYTTVGYATWEAGLATAVGQWNANPTRKQLFGLGTPLPGQVVQDAFNTTGAVATGTTILPSDDTIPQNTEGDQYMSQAVTPTSAANLLRVSSLGFFASSAGGQGAMALFQDAVANALKTAMNGFTNVNSEIIFSLLHVMLAASTATTTFKIRVGNTNAATTTFNGGAGARLYGGTMGSYLRAEEIMG